MQETETPRDRTLDEFIETGERSTIDFKSSLRWDLRNDRINKDLEKIIVKAVAGFMNSESGTLLIGVMDDGQLFGIESDLKTLKKGNKDGFQQAIISLISDYLGTEFTKYAHIGFEEKDEKTVCKIKVKRAPQPVFFKGSDGAKEFYIRAGNTTRMLDSRETHEYIQMHWEA
ncbi:MAG: ATP-binding protein [Euryarchaeota archaeon]|nr:ATP-binding protein [Euryarchaeota archaeon]